MTAPQTPPTWDEIREALKPFPWIASAFAAATRFYSIDGMDKLRVKFHLAEFDYVLRVKELRAIAAIYDRIPEEDGPK